MKIKIDDVEMTAGNFDDFFPDRLIIVKRDGSEFVDELISFLDLNDWDYLSINKIK